MTALLFVGECRSLTAQSKGWTWKDGRLAAKPLFEALQAMGVDPKAHKFTNLWTDNATGQTPGRSGYHEIVVISWQKIEQLKRHVATGVVVALGKRVSDELSHRDVPHVALVHPAARGKIRKRERYHAHVKEKLAPALSKHARITNVSDVPGESWIEKYELQGSRGYRRLRAIPGNGQYAPGHEEIATWLKRLGATHVVMEDAYEEPIKIRKGVHEIEAFIKLARRCDRAEELS